MIASAHSGRNRRNPQRVQVLGSIAEQGGARFEAPETLEALDAIVRDFARQGVETIAVNGGDGTLHRVITAVVPAYQGELPRIAVLPGGTMNIVARSTGWLGKPPEALKRVLQGRTREREVSTLRVGELYGFLWGNGLLARFLEVYEEGDPTVARAAMILGRGALSAVVRGPFVKRLTRRWQGEVRWDGERLERTDWLAVAAGTVEQIGLGFRPFRYTDQPGGMHAVGLGSSVARFAFELPRVYLREPLTSPQNVEQRVSSIQLVADDPIGFMFDGDFHRGDRELTVELGPSVRILVPR